MFWQDFKYTKQFIGFLKESRERGYSIRNLYFCSENSKNLYFIMFIHKLFVFHHNVKMTSTVLKLRLSCFKLLYRNLILLRVIYPSRLKVLLERTLSTHGRLEPKWFFMKTLFSFWTWRRKLENIFTFPDHFVKHKSLLRHFSPVQETEKRIGSPKQY